jgi:rSAM/selenodomain-associated transferase 2
MTISIIIPTLNEASNIGKLIHYLKQNGDASLLEIIVVDAQSTDYTEGVALEAGAKVIHSEKKCRAVQMNLGAKAAVGDVLYFIHADCFPPVSYLIDIQRFIADGYPMGCYRYRFDSNKFLLKINAFFTRFEKIWCRGGDETFYVKRTVFEALGGYNEYYVIMEEYDFIRRAREKYPFKIMPSKVVVSARKYETNSWLRVQLANFTVFRMYAKGVAPEEMAKTYKRMLNYRS